VFQLVMEAHDSFKIWVKICAMLYRCLLHKSMCILIRGFRKVNIQKRLLYLTVLPQNKGCKYMFNFMHVEHAD
jgi:hypothetical protein